MSNITKMSLSKWQKNQSLSLYQYDYGQKLLLTDVDLPNTYEVHFSNDPSQDSITMIGTSSGVDIPDQLLLSGDPVYVWLFLHSGASDGETEYSGKINVIKRSQPSDAEPTLVEQGAIAQAIAALNDAVGRAEDTISYVENVSDHIVDVVNDAIDTAYNSGMFEGQKGDKGDKGDRGEKGDKGDKGDTGSQGPQGETGSTGNGISSVTMNNNDTITFRFTNGDSFTTPNLRGRTGNTGSKGDTGATGPAGPQGETGPEGPKGETGDTGQDGVSPTVAVSSITGGHRITITDAEGDHSFDVSDGAQGIQGVQGVAGPTGATGNGIASIELNNDYTLTVNYTNGDSFTSDSIRGAQGPTGATGATGAQGEQGDPGEDGVGIADITFNNADYTLTITMTNGDIYHTASIRGPQGAAGAQGEQGETGSTGAPGEDGVSPVVDVSTITGGHQVTITDAEGDHTFDVMDGLTAINDSAGSGDTDETWSADKLTEIQEITPESGYSDVPLADLDIVDESGNSIARFENGHVKTKEFDSEQVRAFIKPTNADSSVNLDFTDEVGNVIMRIEDGFVKTRRFDSSHPYVVPDYYFPYLDNKCAQINSYRAACGGDAFFFISDLHVDHSSYTANASQSPKLIKYISEKCRVNKLFCGGDVADGGNGEFYDLLRNAVKGRAYGCNGNHEYMQNRSEAMLRYWYNSDHDDEIGNPDRRYFYVDNQTHRIRYIVLNTFMEDENSNSWAWGLEQDQYTWLDNAMDVESGWTIIIFTHMIYGLGESEDPTLIIAQRHQDFLDHLDAYTGNGTIAAVFCGHTHVDGLKYSTGGIPVFVISCDKYQQYNNTEPWLEGRVLGTITEQCFDVCVVNPEEQKIRTFRIGGVATGDDEDDAAFLASGYREASYS